jgi:hypothetical protein
VAQNKGLTATVQHENFLIANIYLVGIVRRILRWVNSGMVASTFFTVQALRFFIYLILKNTIRKSQ